MEENLEWQIPATKILDHGYIGVVESWGSDARIVEAARMSTKKGFQGWGPLVCPVCDNKASGDDPCPKCFNVPPPGDEKLLNTLWTNHHASPFEMGGLVIELQAPIFVFREWHRHRTQSYNELSARYTPLPDVNYIPTVERCLTVNGSNKQANAIKGADELTHEKALQWLEGLAEIYDTVEQFYRYGLSIGIPKELARLPVPVGRYSRMRASANLRNWLAFCTLRMDSHAQWEIQQYANMVGTYLAQLFPKTWDIYLKEQKKWNPTFGE